MFELTVVTHFAAAHQLKMVGEKCENLHGHNWKIEVRVGGDRLNRAGVLMDFGDIKHHVRQVVAGLDHSFLNDKTFFDETCPPSSENIAVYIAQALQSRIDDRAARVISVTAWESDNASATYKPDP